MQKVKIRTKKIKYIILYLLVISFYKFKLIL